MNADILQYTTQFINDSSIMSVRLVSMKFARIFDIYEHPEYANPMAALFDLFPDKPWDLYNLSNKVSFEYLLKHIDIKRIVNYCQYGKIKWEIVEKHLDLNWKWRRFYNGVPAEFILSNPGFEWNGYLLNNHPDMDIRTILEIEGFNNNIISSRYDITIEIILEYPNFNWSYWQISRHENITIDDILKHPEISWKRATVSSRPDITIQLVLDNPEFDWCWETLGLNKKISWEDIESHPELDWGWSVMQRKSELNKEIILRNLDKEWSWDFIFYHNIVGWEFIQEHPEIEFDIEDLSFVQDLPWDFIEENIHRLDLFTVSEVNEIITINNVLSYKNLNWNWDEIYYRLATIEDVIRHPELGWPWSDVYRKIPLDRFTNFLINWSYISYNENININYVLQNLDKDWNWNSLSMNSSISINDIIEHSDLPWKWFNIKQRKDFNWTYVAKNPNIPWCWGLIFTK